MAEFENLVAVAEIPVNSSIAVQAAGFELLICNANGQIYVVENRCSHQDQPLTGGRIRNGHLSCPIHGMRYRLDNGQPNGTLSRRPLRTFSARVVDGQVQVAL